MENELGLAWPALPDVKLFQLCVWLALWLPEVPLTLCARLPALVVAGFTLVNPVSCTVRRVDPAPLSVPVRPILLPWAPPAPVVAEKLCVWSALALPLLPLAVWLCTGRLEVLRVWVAAPPVLPAVYVEPAAIKKTVLNLCPGTPPKTMQG